MTDKINSNDILLEVWKKSRESVEHLDKIISDFRKIIFAIDGVFVGIAVNLAISGYPKKFYLIGILSIAWSFINFMVWVTEKHYHAYLLASAKVAMRIEEKLGLESDFMLSHMLSKTKSNQPSKIRLKSILISIYDLLYVFPAVALLVLVFIFPVFSDLRLVSAITLAFELLGIYFILKREASIYDKKV